MDGFFPGRTPFQFSNFCCNNQFSASNGEVFGDFFEIVHSGVIVGHVAQCATVTYPCVGSDFEWFGFLISGW